MKHKTFTEYLQEQQEDTINLNHRIMYRWKNRVVINTNHGIERVLIRVKLQMAELKKLLKTALEKIEELKPKLESEILFYSRSLQQGFIGAIDPQGVRIVTFLPPGRSNPRPGTKKFVIEDVDHPGEDVIYAVEDVVEVD